MRQPAVPKHTSTSDDEGAIGRLKPAWSKDVSREISEHDDYILSVVGGLGGCVSFYRRSREADVERMISEVYSLQRLADAARLLPQLGACQASRWT